MIVGIASADYLRGSRSPDGKDRWGGAGWARLGQYVQPLRDAGVEVVVGTLWNEEHGLAVAVGESEEEGLAPKVYPDVVIMQRIMHEGVDQAIAWGQEHGQYVINEMDDWYWGLDTRNEAWKHTHPKFNPGENTTNYRATMKASDMIVVSTPFLGDRMATMAPNADIRHLPNMVDVSRFTQVTHHDTFPTVGWVGSTAHRSGDVETLRGVLTGQVNRGAIQLHHSGDHISAPSFAEQIGISVDQISTTPRCESSDYPGLLNFDVGLVPLRNTPFNEAKSAIKGLEYAAAGIPFVASDLPAYRKLWTDWDRQGFYLATKPKQWQKAIGELIDPVIRRRKSAECLDWVQTRDLHFGTSNWLTLLEEINATQGR